MILYNHTTKMMSSIFLLVLFFSVATANQLFFAPETYFANDPADAQSIYQEWYATQQIGERYASSTFLPNYYYDTGVAVHWQIDGNIQDDDAELHLAVVAMTEGWLAFGLSQAGGMLGADMVYWEAAHPDRLTDAYVVENRFPLRDDPVPSCHADDKEDPNSGQDWTLVHVYHDQGMIAWQGRRKLRTASNQDYDIEIDDKVYYANHKVIAAWGGEPTMQYHGKNVAKGAVRFFTTPQNTISFEKEMEAADGSFLLLSNNHTIASVKTEYVDFCFYPEDLKAAGVPIGQKAHWVGVEAVFSNPDTRRFVHHFAITGGSAVPGECESESFMNSLFCTCGVPDEAHCSVLDIGKSDSIIVSLILVFHSLGPRR